MRPYPPPSSPSFARPRYLLRKCPICPPPPTTTTLPLKGDFRVLRRCLVNRAPLVVSSEYDMTIASYAPASASNQLVAAERQMAAGLQTWSQALLKTWERASSGNFRKMGVAGSSSVANVSAPSRRLRQRGELGGPAPAAGWDLRRSLEGTAPAPAPAPVAGDELPWSNQSILEPLTQLGCSQAEAARFLSAYWVSVLGTYPLGPDPSTVPGPHRNVVQELRIRGSSYFTNIFSKAVTWMLRDEVTPDTVSQRASAETEALLSLAAKNRTRLAYKYCKDIGWSGSETPVSRHVDGRGDGGASAGRADLSGGQLAAVIVVSVCALCMVVLGVAAAAMMMRRRRWAAAPTATGPPGPGLGTSLILTDIQNSTVLWESLPAEIMDVALRCHNEVLRGLLHECKGYESATEGDAFILAFHSVEDAARYAVAAQERLLTAPWPTEMLFHPDCEVVWMAPNRADPVAALSYVSRDLLAAACRMSGAAAGPPPPACRTEGGIGGTGVCKGATAVSPESPLPLQSTSRLADNVRRAAACCGYIAPGGGGGSGGPRQIRGGGASEGTAAAGGPDGAIGSGGGSGNFNKAMDNLLGRIAAANSSHMKSKMRHLALSGDETSPWRGDGGDVAAPSASAASATAAAVGLTTLHQLTRISPLEKAPSDIRSYMTETEAEFEVPNHPEQSIINGDMAIGGDGGGAEGGTQSSSAAAAAAAVVVAMAEAPPPPTLSKAPSLATAGCCSGQGPRVASRLQQSSAFGGSPGATGSVSDGVPPPMSVLLGLVATAPAAAVSTLAEALRRGWRKVPPPGADGYRPAGDSATANATVGDEDDGGGGGGGAVVATASAAAAATTEPLLAYRGMRVRMGIHTGADLGEVSPNNTTGRTQYSGCFMTVAKAVCDAAHGGQVLLSPAAFKRLPQNCLGKAAFLLHMGGHVLAEGEEPGALYQLLPCSLACRMPTFEPLRTHEYLALGLPDAPVGRVTVAFMYVIGAQALLAWNAVLAGDALAIFHNTVSEQIHGTDGYVVELVDGLCLAAFRSPADALLWSLRCGRLLLSAPWSDELLEHELCEEVSLLVHNAVNGNGAPGGPQLGSVQPRPQSAGNAPFAPTAAMNGSYHHLQNHLPLQTLPLQHSLPAHYQHQQPRAFTLPRASAIRRKVLMRGLRLKVGIDVGLVADSINATTGRMAYRGRTMNRAARIASRALAGQVHCSAAVWAAAADRLAALAGAPPGTPGYGEEEVAATSLGLQSLKGVMDKIEIMSVSYKDTALTQEEAAVVAKRAPRQSGSSCAISSTAATTYTNTSGGVASSGFATTLSIGHLSNGTSAAAAAAASAAYRTGMMAAAGVASKGNPFQRRSVSGLPISSFDRLSPVNPNPHRSSLWRMSHKLLLAGARNSDMRISENGCGVDIVGPAAGVGGLDGAFSGRLAADRRIYRAAASEGAGGGEVTRSLHPSPSSQASSPGVVSSCLRARAGAGAPADLPDDDVCISGSRAGGGGSDEDDRPGSTPAVPQAAAVVPSASASASAAMPSVRPRTFQSRSEEHVVVHLNPLATGHGGSVAIRGAEEAPKPVSGKRPAVCPAVVSRVRVLGERDDSAGGRAASASSVAPSDMRSTASDEQHPGMLPLPPASPTSLSPPTLLAAPDESELQPAGTTSPAQQAG
ncbi:hypothetical protein Vretifemale_16198 [Volvox reticuliferus]|uniref:Guanylate cyclase domain-containing protein n=1 Tax=Volvox reticuliferus TaxID=1737510 RepID=A0A8J4FTG9_9CHLO|nr:hypothetical protein Vretifemale_16198 [Volvox reticuliferus]